MEAALKLFYGKCCYCEQPLGKRIQIDIEQHRPKTNAVGFDGPSFPLHYAWLAYEWENIYPACLACNRNKKTTFPILGSRAKVGETDPSALAKERPLLLDPCRDHPELYLEFDVDGSVRSTGYGVDDCEGKDRGTITIEVLGLDRPALRKLRKKEWDRFRKQWSTIESHLRDAHKLQTFDTVGQALLDEATGSHLPFAATRRQCLARMYEDTPIKNKAIGSLGWYLELLKREGRQPRKPKPPRTKQRAPKKPKKLATEAATVVPKRATFIKRIKLKRFKAIEKLELQLPQAPSEPILPDESADLDERIKQQSMDFDSSDVTLMGWTTFLGENGSGKSTILQAIALALAGDAILNNPMLSPEKYLMRGRRWGSVELELSTHSEPIILKITKNQFKFETSTRATETLVRAYGATRLPPTASNGKEKSTNGDLLEKPATVQYRNLFETITPLIDVDRWLSGLHDHDLDAAKLAIKDLVGAEDESFVAIENGQILLDDQPLENQSSGYQTLVALACDIMAGVPVSLSDMRYAGGIILLDELGTHLHPRWKMWIARRLRSTFSGMQFITSTHEPLCLRGHSKGEVMLVRRDFDESDTSRTGERTVSVDENLPSPRRMRVDQLLTSAYFGLGSTIDPDIDQLFSDYYQLLAIPEQKRTEEQKAHVNTLKRMLRFEGVLGYTRRDRLVYDLIDNFLANNRTTAEIKLEDIPDNIKQRVADLWQYAKASVAKEKG